MGFDEILAEMLAATDGAEACFMFDRDGILIQEVSVPDSEVDLQSLGAEISAILKNVQLASESLELGPVEEFGFSAATYSVLIRNVVEEYHVALVLKPDGSVGKGRYVLRSRSPQLREEI